MHDLVTGRAATPSSGSADITLALHETVAAAQGPEPGSQAWRWKVRRSLTAVRDVLEAVPLAPGGWLTARSATSQREQQALLLRVRSIGPRVLTEPDHRAVVSDVLRLVSDLQRHFQRLNDLAYDEVEIELGGSE